MNRLARSLILVAATLLAGAAIAAAQTATLSIQDQTITGTNGTPEHAQIVATGASGYYVMGGSMPYGLVLDSGTGAVTGTPTMAGHTMVQVKVTDTSGHSALGNVTVSIAASSDPTPPTIADQTFPGTVGTTLNAQIQATNANEYAVTQGSLPAGLTLNTATGGVNGIPQTAGNTTVVVQVKNGAGTAASGNVTFAIAGTTPPPPPSGGSGPTIADQKLTGTDGSPVQYQIVASGATAYYVIGNLMPYGLQLDPSTGAVTGTPTMSGTTNVTIKVTDGNGNAAQANLEVAIAPATNPTGPTITNQSFSGTVGTPMSAQIVASGATAFHVTSGSLPAGLSLNATTGMVNGSPQAAGTSSATVQVSDANARTAQATVTFTIAAGSDPNPPTIQDQTINGTMDEPISARIQATNTTSFWAPVQPMPPGIQLDAATGAVTGTPSVAGTTTITIEARDAAGSTADANVTFVIAGTNSQPVITQVSVDPGDHTLGVALSVTYSRQVSVAFQPVLHLTIGGTPVVARFGYPDLSGGDRHVIHFAYAVQDGVHGPLVIQSPIDLLNGTIASDDGLAAALTFAPPDTSGVYVGVDPGQPAKTAQTITFTAPPDGLTIGQPVTLNASSSAGLPITYTLQGGDATLKDGVLTPLSTDTIVVGAANAGDDTYVSAYKQVNFGNPKPVAEQSVIAGASVAATTDKPLTLTAASTQPVKYTVLSGPATIHGDTVMFTGSGNVTVAAVTQVDATHQTTATMTVAGHPVARFVNVSSRVHVVGGSDGATVGFVITGNAPKPVLLRAVGESLAPFGVTDGLVGPTLTLYAAKGVKVAANTGWGDDAGIATAGSAVGAFALTPGKSDAALLVTLAPGAYTAQVTSPNSGSVLLEVYDVAATEAVPTKQLINISTRAHVDGSTGVEEGFVISGDEPKRVLIRAVGPTLATFGVTDPVANPAVTVHAGGAVVASDDDWGTAGTGSSGVTVATPAEIASAADAVGAFGLPAGSRDAALLVTLPPGLYSAVVSGSAGQAGTVLVEVYEVP